MKFQHFTICSFILFGVLSVTQAQSGRRCNIAYRCSDEERPVWATTNGQFCEVFRNNCYFLSENCNRLRENKTEAVIIGKGRCQELCRQQVCLAVYDPVCGIYNGRRRTFGNSCEMGRHICTTGRTYTLYRNGAC